MDTIICSSTAYRYWRMPPVVQLLTVGPEDDCLLRKMMAADDLFALRLELAQTLPLSAACASGCVWRAAGENARKIRELHALLAPAAKAPIDILVHESKHCHRSTLIRPRLWSAELPVGALTQIASDAYVTSPAFTLLQLAATNNLTRTVLLASELCGSFSVFKAPAPIARVLQQLIDRRALPEIDGWRPALKDGRLTDLWTRPPLIDPADLRMIAAASDARNGKATLSKAAELVVPGAASPLEVQTGVLLGFPRRLGGEGISGFRHNERVGLSSEAKTLAKRDYCSCDLYWDDGLDIECQSAQYHSNLEDYLSDSERAAALKLMGVEVLPVTYSQLAEEARFDALVSVISRIRDLKLSKKSDRQRAKTLELRREVFCDWSSLPD